MAGREKQFLVYDRESDDPNTPMLVRRGRDRYDLMFGPFGASVDFSYLSGYGNLIRRYMTGSETVPTLELVVSCLETSGVNSFTDEPLPVNKKRLCGMTIWASGMVGPHHEDVSSLFDEYGDWETRE